ncbi:hypothetical protein [Streptomyces sp. P9-A2]|uniref:hypothetical protein n=1 Tax=Streptomyces sp. P9-A2 TaxID=3072284 RepID=UPI002FC8E92F
MADGIAGSLVVGGSLVRSYRTPERVTLEQQMSAPDVEWGIAALCGELPRM